MKRSGFTMIELIFVIVILGILAAVALPKFIGVSEQAQAGKVAAYVGTLNRTVAPALWSQSLANRDNGSMLPANVTSGTVYNDELLTQITTPTQVGDTAAQDLTPPTVSTCTAYALPATPTAGYTDAELLAWTTVSTATIGGDLYEIKCMDGSATEAPHFILGRAPAPAAASTIVVVR
jgi:prepilin-type N-terminal cleavage/methylation domain-containing protein